MKTSISALMAATCLALSAPIFAQVDVSNAWIRGIAPGQTATGAFMTLHAHQNAKLVGASSGVARVTEIHEMKMDGNTMRMRAIPALALPSMQDVELKPGGYHVMLMNLKRALKVGEQVPLTLSVELANGKIIKQVVQAEVRALTTQAATAPAASAHGTHKH